MQIHAHEMPTLCVNRAQIQQVFLNLIGNAIKYSKKNTQPVPEILAEEQSDIWLFQIKDNGEGMHEDYHDKAFEPFQRIGNTERSGTGMGLAICNKVIDLHNGDIWFHSHLEEGTTFCFTITKNLCNKKV